MATAKDLEMHLSCPICLEIFRSPKVLPCVHSFCEKCLHSYIVSTTHNRRCFECPMCRVITYPVNKELPVSDWAQQFPSNHLIVSLLEDSIKPTSEKCSIGLQITGIVCAPCSQQNKQEKVFCFCATCCEYLCKNCHDDHSKFKLMRNHNILKGDELPKDTSHFQRMSEITHCNDHKEKEIEYLCVSHAKFICSDCVKSIHKSCQDIEHISEIPTNKDACKNYLEQSRTLKAEVESLLHGKLDFLEYFNKKSVDLIETKSSLISDLRNILNYYEENSLRTSQEKIESIKEKVSENINQCTGFIDIITRDSEFAETVMKFGSENNLNLAMKVLDSAQSGIKQGLSSLEQNAVKVTFSTPEEEKKLLESLLSMIKRRLDIKETVTDDQVKPKDVVHFDSNSEPGCSGLNIPNSHNVHKNSYPLPVHCSSISNRPFMECDVRKIAEHNISVQGLSENPCQHKSCALLPDGKMVFIDMGNHCVKLIGTDFKVLDAYKLESHPNDVIVLHEDKVAVALGKDICLYKILENNIFMKYKVFETRDIITSVCCIRNKIGILHTKEDGATSTYIETRSIQNKIIDTIYGFCDTNGEMMELNHPLSIRSRYPDEILVAEFKQLKAFDVDGDLSWYFKYLGHSIQSIAVDPDKNIYICDYSSNRIHQVSAKSFKRHRVLISDTGIQGPLCMLVNSKNRSVVIGFNDSNIVQVYQFL